MRPTILSLPVAAATMVASLLLPTVLAVDPCKTQRNNQFSSTVYVEFGMDHGQALSTNEINNMEAAFVEAYNLGTTVNEFNQEHCDLYFMRSVDSCDIEALDAFYLYENGNKIYRRLFKFDCQGSCKNCGPGKSLLDAPIDNRRQLATKEEEVFEAEQQSQAEDNRELFFVPPVNAGSTCQCHKDATIRGQTELEFRSALKVEVNKQKEANKLVAVKSVLRVIQMEKKSCSTADNEFETVVVVKLDGDPQPKDLYALGNGFLDSFNELSSNYCDSLHRRVTGVVVKERQSSRRRLGTRRRYRLKISGRCRGCIRNARLFNDSFLRRLGGKEEEDAEARALSGTGTCHCPKYPVANRNVKSSEFQPFYSRTVRETNNVAVDDVDELTT